MRTAAAQGGAAAPYLCYLSLGANLGRRAETLRAALRELSAFPRTRLLRSSSFYETAPWGKTDQPPFLNAAAQLLTQLPPEELLDACQQIERAHGRVRHEHWGARTLDIDLVYAPGKQVDTPSLRLPHPYLLERAFVLVPLLELAPSLMLAGRPVRDWAAAARGQGIRRTSIPSSPFPLRLIACLDEGRGLGLAGRLLYDLPEDRHRFRRLTQAAAGILIMGRRTQESLPGGRPLPGRTNIVLSRQARAPEGFLVAQDIPALFAQLDALWMQADREQRPMPPAWLIGGGETYRALLPLTGEAYLTEVRGRRAADTFLPPLDGFDLVRREPRSWGCFSLYRRRCVPLWGDQYERKKENRGNLS